MSNIHPLFPQYPHMLHGGDCNPDQWKATPEIRDEDTCACGRVSMLNIGDFDFEYVKFTQNAYAARFGGKSEDAGADAQIKQVFYCFHYFGVAFILWNRVRKQSRKQHLRIG